MCTASVLKSKGRKIRVAGSSFITSTNTSSAAVSTLPHIIGPWTCKRVAVGREPRVRAARSMFSVTLARLDSTVWKEMARKRTTYPNSNATRVPERSSPVEMPKVARIQPSTALSSHANGNMTPTATTGPGMA